MLCVTHLPQIAAMADRQYTVEKRVEGGRTYTRVHLLDEDGRVQELARLVGGAAITETTLAGARELLTTAEILESRELTNRTGFLLEYQTIRYSAVNGTKYAAQGLYSQRAAGSV